MKTIIYILAFSILSSCFFNEDWVVKPENLEHVYIGIVKDFKFEGQDGLFSQRMIIVELESGQKMAVKYWGDTICQGYKMYNLIIPGAREDRYTWKP